MERLLERNPYNRTLAHASRDLDYPGLFDRLYQRGGMDHGALDHATILGGQPVVSAVWLGLDYPPGAADQVVVEGPQFTAEEP